jgi:hypothetical protein
MLIYFDLLSNKEIGSDSFDVVEPCKGIKGLVAKRITINDAEVDIGANASTEAQEEDEGVDASEAKTVINIVHNHNLQTIQLDKKEYRSMTAAYFKDLMKKLTKNKYDALEFENDYEPPSDKKEAADAEAKAAAELTKFTRGQYEQAVKAIETYKANFAEVQKFINDDILKNYDECEFYTCEDGELGRCMIIPARYVGEATAPTFYYFSDGLNQKKA